LDCQCLALLQQQLRHRHSEPNRFLREQRPGSLPWPRAAFVAVLPRDLWLQVECFQVEVMQQLMWDRHARARRQLPCPES